MGTLAHPFNSGMQGSGSMLLEHEASDANHINSPSTCGKYLAKPRICKGYDNNTSEMSASQVCKLSRSMQSNRTPPRKLDPAEKQSFFLEFDRKMGITYFGEQKVL